MQLQKPSCINQDSNITLSCNYLFFFMASTVTQVSDTVGITRILKKQRNSNSISVASTATGIGDIDDCRISGSPRTPSDTLFKQNLSTSTPATTEINLDDKKQPNLQVAIFWLFSEVFWYELWHNSWERVPNPFILWRPPILPTASSSPFLNFKLCLLIRSSKTKQVPPVKYKE